MNGGAQSSKACDANRSQALPPIRPRAGYASGGFRWSGTCAATLSGAVSPAGGLNLELDRLDDLGPLGLVLFLAQQARIPKFLELPEPDSRVTLRIRGPGCMSTS